MRAALAGAALVALYTALIAAADGITKLIAGSYAAPQFLAVSSALVLLFALGAARRQGALRTALGVQSRGTMALRSLLTVLAAIGFFQAFRLLPFADVFLFIGLMPLIAAALSGVALDEPVRPAAWLALALGASGLLALMPEGRAGGNAGHVWALLGAVSGTASMVAARAIARRERKPLAQVFWPNLALALVMGMALPFVWQPMPLADWLWVAGYALFLFGARFVSVEALRLLPAYVATPLMNLQFVWMVGIGVFCFGELPGVGASLGAALVIGSGLWLVADEALPARRRLRL
ncbi:MULTISPECIES: DMT family transporter [unclassified Salipiger]|uniref:DMT family transporter n=1 Tax=unclassified Salipiger TaxID=2640570 RepID=UPI0013BD4C89|nr:MULTISPECIES: DMT family transporter [unclassified Salipiger]NDV50869.1 DMT family transporter [Salipiger sp. PrR003]NDW34075.1 DMT family transporter [Salipiger sp. PrR007]